jgi:secreted trypsin-like serine protease
LFLLETENVMRRVQKVIYHIDYNPQTLSNDIALLKISAVNYTNTISPICLPKQGDNLAQPGKTGFVTGWGRTSGYNDENSHVLRQVNVNVFECPSNNYFNVICANQQTPSGVQGSCKGDSGGPLAIKQGSNYFLSGIVSRGHHDCSYYSVYVKVSDYIDWINSIKQNN